MSDIIRSAIAAQLTEFPLSWRKDAPDHWVAKVGDLTCSVWPSYGRGGWGWELTGRGNSEVASGQSDGRRGAMNAAEAAAKQHQPTQTDVQIVTGWLARRSEVPAEVLAAALRLAERDRVVCKVADVADACNLRLSRTIGKAIFAATLPAGSPPCGDSDSISSIVEVVDKLRLRAEKAERERDALAGNMGRPWGLPSLLERLADAADHLLKDHNCDVHGHEGIGLARDEARALLAGFDR